jgi:hypothetical protein
VRILVDPSGTDLNYAFRYDVSGVHPDKIQRVLEQDWMHLMHDKCILDSPNYLREKGSPVIALWGVPAQKIIVDVHLIYFSRVWIQQ